VGDRARAEWPDPARVRGRVSDCAGLQQPANRRDAGLDAWDRCQSRGPHSQQGRRDEPNATRGARLLVPNSLIELTYQRLTGRLQAQACAGVSRRTRSRCRSRAESGMLSVSGTTISMATDSDPKMMARPWPRSGKNVSARLMPVTLST